MRQTITNLLATVAAQLPDNDAELITPAALRGVLLDYAESMTPVTALVGGSPLVPVPMMLSTTPAKIPGGVFSVVVNGNPNFIEARTPQDDVLLKTAVGRALISFNVTWAGGNGIDVAFTLARNGTPLVFRAVDTGRGLANQLSTEFSWIFETLVVNDVIELYAASLTGTPSINFTNGAIKALLLPQFA